jgi:hypothetical protein
MCELMHLYTGLTYRCETATKLQPLLLQCQMQQPTRCLLAHQARGVGQTEKRASNLTVFCGQRASARQRKFITNSMRDATQPQNGCTIPNSHSLALKSVRAIQTALIGAAVSQFWLRYCRASDGLVTGACLIRCSVLRAHRRAGFPLRQVPEEGGDYAGRNDRIPSRTNSFYLRDNY